MKCTDAVTVENVTHIFVFLLPIMIFLIYFFVPHPLGKISMRKTEKIWGCCQNSDISSIDIYSARCSCGLDIGRYIPAPMLGCVSLCPCVSRNPTYLKLTVAPILYRQ